MKRPSDGVVSEPLPFEYLPLDTGRRSLWATTRKDLKQKMGIDGDGNNGDGHFDFFQLLVANEQAILAATQKSSVLNNKPAEIIDLDTPIDDGNQKPLPIDDAMDGIETVIDVNGKTTEWINKTEFTTSQSVDDGSTVIVGDANSTGEDDEDKTLHELLDQVAELDEIYTDHQLRRDDDNHHIEMELNGLEHAMPAMHHDGAGGVGVENGNGGGNVEENIDFDELFDDAATYSSLQIAFKNPISIIEPIVASPPPPVPPPHATNDFHYNAPRQTSPNSPTQSSGDASTLKRESPNQLVLEEGKLPPLPPKRIKKAMPLPENDENEPIIGGGHTGAVVEENGATVAAADTVDDPLSRRGSAKSLKPRPQSQIIIMKPPNQSPLNKKLPPAPPTTTTANKSKKSPGFFSKLFSRRKSKSDLIEPSPTSKSALDISMSAREPSVHSFTVTDPSAETTVVTSSMNRASTRSNKSLQIPAATNASGPNKRGGKPVGRSVSSVSGKRPHLTADIVHIPLKGDSSDSLPMRSGSGPMLPLPGGTEAYERASTATLSNNLDRKTVSALQLADLPLQDSGMELIAIADRQSLRNLCEGEFGVTLDPSVDLTEAEHYALYTSVAPHATQSEFDEGSCYYAPVEAGEILTQDEVARRLAGQFS